MNKLNDIIYSILNYFIYYLRELSKVFSRIISVLYYNKSKRNLIIAINSIFVTKQFDTIKCIMNNFNAQKMSEQYSNKYIEIVKRNGNEH